MGFLMTVTQFIANYIPDSALNKQSLYLSTLKKPFKMTVRDLGQRLRQINKYMRFFPAAMMTKPYTKITLKNLLYNMMPVNRK